MNASWVQAASEAYSGKRLNFSYLLELTTIYTSSHDTKRPAGYILIKLYQTRGKHAYMC